MGLVDVSQDSVPGGPAEIFLVGLRWKQHAAVSGYDAIGRHLGQRLQLPITDRWHWDDGSQRSILFRAYHRARSALEYRLEQLTKPTYSLSLLRMELAVARHMLWRRGAVYHVLYGETDIWLMPLVGRLTRNYVVASFHEGPEVMSDCGVNHALLRHLSGVVALGECQRQYLLEAAEHVPLAVIPHGVDTQFFQPRSDPSRRPQGRPIILTVGGHTRDYHTFSLAVDRILAAEPDARVVAVSANVGIKHEPLTHPAVEHVTGVSDEELRNLYQHASVALFSFRYAVANNAILEAMACGVPIVASDVGAVAEYVPSSAGILTPVGDANRLADAVIRVLQDSDLADGLSRSARQTSLRYDIAETCRLLLNFYDTALKDAEDKRSRGARSRPRNQMQNTPTGGTPTTLSQV